MPDSTSERTLHEQQLNALIAEYLQAADEGRPLDQADFIRQHPEFEAELREFFADLRQIEKVAPPLQSDSKETRPDGNSWRTLSSPGTIIGPYKLLQKIGEGGMGVVYMAEQTHPVQRKVAIKVIKPGMDSRQVIARFEAERQALAIMDHVNIARVLDAGTTEAGRPYFVMELVHGVPITKYCDDNRLTPHQRLELFVPVCQAIQHAHQKGIIHRDIKPSNVMITLYDGQPVPKVIDFGVAKAIEQKLTEKTLFTQYGTMVGTLEYMSPEQAEMSAMGMDTRSDIYSLGVLLYELLTGSTPLSRNRMKEVAYGEILRIIKEEEPPRPSTRLSDSGDALASISAQRHMEPAKLSKLLRGELDWIVMKTLEKDRNRRYETASAFAADVRRYLNDEPVEACPPSVAYRMKKLLRQYKGPVVTAALLLLALVVGVIGTTLGLLQARHEAANANKARGDEQLARRQAEAARDREKLAHEQADSARLQAESKSAESQNRLVRLHVANGVALVDQGDPLGALPWFTEALKEDRGNPAREEMHRIRLSAIIQQSPRLKQVWFHDKDMIAHHAEFSPDGRHVLIATGIPAFIQGHHGEARIWDAETGKPASPPLRDEHKHPVWQARFSPNGRFVVTAGGGTIPVDKRTVKGGGEARVWDARSGQPITAPLKSRWEIKSVAFNTEGSLILTVAGSECRVWNASTGEAAGEPVDHSRANSIAFSPEGKRIAVAAWMQAYVADAITGEKITPILEHTYKSLGKGGGLKGTVAHIAFNSEGTQVVTASHDETARIWDATTGKPLTASLKHYGNVNYATFSADGKLVVTASDDGMARIWNAATGELEAPLIKHTGPVTHAWFSPDGKSVATISGTAPLRDYGDNCYQLARVWDSATGQPLTPPLRHGARVTWASFSPDSSRLLTASADRTVRLWELAPVAESTVPFVNVARASHGVISPDVSLVLTKNTDESAHLWNLASGKEVALAGKFSGYVQYLAFSANGKRVLATNGSSPWGPFRGDGAEGTYADKNQASVYDAATGNPVGPPLKHGSIVLHASFSPEAQRIVTASEDKTARVWDVVTGEPLSPPLKHEQAIHYAAWSPEGKRVATAGWDGVIRIWDATSGEQLGPVIRAGRSPCHVSFSPHGRQILVTGYDRSAALWDVETGQASSPVIKHNAHLLGVTFAGGECRILVALDSVARVWNVTKGVPQTSLLKHLDRINSGTFSPDGRLVATASVDGTARAWDAATGELITLPLVHGPALRMSDGGNYAHSDLPQAAFTPDGRRIVVVSWSGIRTWNLEPDRRSIDELVLEAQALSGSTIDRIGGQVPVDPDTIWVEWKKR